MNMHNLRKFVVDGQYSKFLQDPTYEIRDDPVRFYLQDLARIFTRVCTINQPCTKYLKYDIIVFFLLVNKNVQFLVI